MEPLKSGPAARQLATLADAQMVLCHASAAGRADCGDRCARCHVPLSRRRALPPRLRRRFRPRPPSGPPSEPPSTQGAAPVASGSGGGGAGGSCGARQSRTPTGQAAVASSSAPTGSRDAHKCGRRGSHGIGAPREGGALFMRPASTLRRGPLALRPTSSQACRRSCAIFGGATAAAWCRASHSAPCGPKRSTTTCRSSTNTSDGGPVVGQVIARGLVIGLSSGATPVGIGSLAPPAGGKQCCWLECVDGAVGAGALVVSDRACVSDGFLAVRHGCVVGCGLDGDLWAGVTGSPRWLARPNHARGCAGRRLAP